MQVAESVERYGQSLGLKVLPVYGGQSMDQQLSALVRGVDIIVATPGRALDHLRRGSIKLGGIAVAVLDEADEMLDMGFAEDIESLLSATPPERQTMLFSATMPPRIKAIAGRHLKDAVEVLVVPEAAPAGTAPKVRQVAYLVPRAQKLAALGRVLDAESPKAALIFCQTRSEVDQLTEALAARGYRPEAIHGGMSQDQRDRVMRLFRSGKADLLVATDVAARGLDVEHLTHVVNYQLPIGTEAYVHRIGRVGRAGREGMAITVVEPREQSILRSIERVTGQRFEMARVPTNADLQLCRLERTKTAIRETIAEGGLEDFQAMIASLGEEFDAAAVALAALKLAHRAEVGVVEDGEDIAVASPEPARPEIRARGRNARANGPRLARLFINAGREAGVSPKDLVGAIANEAGLPGRDIRGIEITERFSLVEIPEDAAEHVIESLNGARLRGRRISVRRDRQDEGSR
jgi:ATP-dependent RNA helicase DeaD